MLNIFNYIKTQLMSKKILNLALTLTLLSGCSFLDKSGTKLKISDQPAGELDTRSGQLITFGESKRINSKQMRINFKNSESRTALKSTEIVVAKFSNQIRLIDFYIPEHNENPELSFESTARSLVIMNPIFLGLSLENIKLIFKDISKDKEFKKLIDLVAKSNSLLSDEIVELSSSIAIRVAIDQGILINWDNTNSFKESEASGKSFETNIFPQKSCGDIMPSNPKDYPVYFYPIFIEYSEYNLQKVTSEFCQDAYQLVRKTTKKEAIQVASFLDIEKANAFKEIMLKNFGSGEVGEPKLIEAPNSFLNKHLYSQTFFRELTNLLTKIIVPAVNAQTASSWLEYSIINQFTNDGLFPGTQWPLWHGLELKANSNGIKIVGTSPIAQQVIVIPQDAKDRGISTIVDQLIYPANLGTWDGNTLKTLSGGNQLDIQLLPKEGKSWKEDSYDVLISGGYSLKRTSQSNKYEAFDINILLFVADVINLASGEKKDIKTIVNQDVNNLSQITVSCITALEQKTNKTINFSAFSTLIDCLRGTDNLQRIAQILGVENEKIFIDLFSYTLQFQGKAWESMLKKAAKKSAQSIDVFDKTVGLGRIFVFGKYLEHENQTNTYYYGTFSISSPSQSYASRSKTEPLVTREVELNCYPNESNKKQYQELDLVIEVSCWGSSEKGISRIKVTNYSNKAVEISLPVPGFLPDLLLPDESQVYYPTTRWEVRDQWKNRPEGIQQDALSSLDLIERFLPSKLLLTLNSYSSGQIIKEVLVRCSDKTQTIWGVKISPKCVPPGIRATYQNETFHPISLAVVGSNIPVIDLAPRPAGSSYLLGGSGRVKSSTKEVTLSIIVNY